MTSTNSTVANAIVAKNWDVGKEFYQFMKGFSSGGDETPVPRRDSITQISYDLTAYGDDPEHIKYAEEDIMRAVSRAKAYFPYPKWIGKKREGKRLIFYAK
jgi:hypothetical protein